VHARAVGEPHEQVEHDRLLAQGLRLDRGVEHLHGGDRRGGSEHVAQEVDQRALRAWPAEEELEHEVVGGEQRAAHGASDLAVRGSFWPGKGFESHCEHSP
jgi:hypothetical protein